MSIEPGLSVEHGPSQGPDRTTAGDASRISGRSQQCLTQALLPCLDLWQALGPEAADERRQPALIEARVARSGCTNVLGMPLRPLFDPPKGSHYEVAILREGRIAFRLGSWHDWFNLLCWQLWPQSKAVLNLRHVMHYLMQLQQRHPKDWTARIGQSVARDVWMQTIAMLDEGGCVATQALLSQKAALDGRRVYRWQTDTTHDDIFHGLRWFGHGALEQLQLRAEEDARLSTRRSLAAGVPAEAPEVSEQQQSLSTSPGPKVSAERQVRPVMSEEQQCVEPPPTENGLRMFVAVVPELNDAVLARAILRFDPSLEGMVENELKVLESLGIFIPDSVLQIIAFGAGDLFLKPAASVWNPWSLTEG